jgi:hypothetical protein
MYASRFKDEPRFETMFCFPALIIRHQPRHCQRILRFVEVDDLPICVGLKGGERREEIDRFEHGCFALRVTACQHNSPPWKFCIQAGETAEIGERDVFEVHVALGGWQLAFSGHVVSCISSSSSSRKGILFIPIKGMDGLSFLDSFTAPRRTAASSNPRFW